MSRQEEVSALKLRIARSEQQRDAWRAAGREEKYLEAYFMVEALELQLTARLAQGAVETSS